MIHFFRSKLYAIIVFFICLTASIYLVWQLEQSEIEDYRERAQQAALIQASRIQRTLDDMLYTSRTIKAFLEQEDGKMHNFPAIAASVIEGYPISNIALAPGGIITQVYPFEGNEAALNHNLFEDAARSTETVSARDSGEYTLTGPYELRQGGYGIIGRLPIYLDDPMKGEYFWGFVCITLMLPDAFENIAMEHIENLNYAYEVWRINPDTGNQQIILTSPAPILYPPEKAPINLPNSTWYLSLAPVTGWINTSQLALWLLVTTVISFLLSMVFYYTWELTHKKQELDFNIRQQTANYQRMNQLNQELRIFKHDTNNHLLSLSDLLEHRDYDNAKEYLASMSSLIANTGRFINTENYVFDALLSQKLEAAHQKGIGTETEICIPRQLNIKNTDWTTLFGNALDNSIEACDSISHGDRKILIYVQCTGDMLKVRIANTAVSAPMFRERSFLTTKPDTAQHGIGIGSMTAAVKRYDGELDTEFKDGIFTLSFILLHI